MFTYIGLSFCVVAYFVLGWVRRHVRVPDLTHKYVLIAGCDTGFGNFLAQKLDMMGVNVFAACLTEAAQNRLKLVTSSRLQTLILDITKQDQVSQAVDFVRHNLPENEGLWGLVNNAGTLGSVLGPPEWLSAEDFADVFDVNTLGLVRVTLAFLPLLKRAKGRVVSMSSMAARVPSPFVMPYGVSKAGVEWFSDGIRAHVSQYGVSVHIVEPGSFNTGCVSNEGLRKAVQRGWDQAPRYVREEYGREYFHNLIDFISDSTKLAPLNMNKTVAACVHALTARCPRLRYTVGWHTKLMLLPLAYAPSQWLDRFHMWSMKKLVPVVLEDRSNVPIPGSLSTFVGGK